jgi:hypothetical protein
LAAKAEYLVIYRLLKRYLKLWATPAGLKLKI